MNTKKSKLADLKKVINIPVLLIAFGLFVQRTYATPIEKIIEKNTGNNIRTCERSDH